MWDPSWKFNKTIHSLAVKAHELEDIDSQLRRQINELECIIPTEPISTFVSNFENNHKDTLILAEYLEAVAIYLIKIQALFCDGDLKEANSLTIEPPCKSKELIIEGEKE